MIKNLFDEMSDDDKAKKAEQIAKENTLPLQESNPEDLLMGGPISPQTAIRNAIKKAVTKTIIRRGQEIVTPSQAGKTLISKEPVSGKVKLTEEKGMEIIPNKYFTSQTPAPSKKNNIEEVTKKLQEAIKNKKEK